MKKQTDGDSVEIETPVAMTQAADEASEESLIETEAEAAMNDGYPAAAADDDDADAATDVLGAVDATATDDVTHTGDATVAAEMPAMDDAEIALQPEASTEAAPESVAAAESVMVEIAVQDDASVAVETDLAVETSSAVIDSLTTGDLLSAEGQSPPGTVATNSDSSAPEAALSGGGFAGLGLSAALLYTLEQSGYSVPTPVQSRTIPFLLQGRDVLGQAQTGSGKTAAFALPLLQNLDLSLRQTQALILVPTRELALQVTLAFEKYAAGFPSFRCCAVYGGAAYGPQLSKLRQGAHVVVGTPGRVMDHMTRGTLDVSSLTCLVLDEADEMLRMGFAESVEWVLSQIPHSHQTALFSATMPHQIQEIAAQYLNEPEHVIIRQKSATADTIEQRYVIVAPFQREQVLLRILEVEDTDGIIVFVRTRSSTEPLAELLSANGYRAAALNGEMAQAQRERIVRQLREGRLDALVATDVAARGLDVERITHVVNYDPPRDHESYIHRIGRTGRAGRKGTAILLVGPRAPGLVRRLERGVRQDFDHMPIPSSREVNKKRVARFHQQLEEAQQSRELETMQSIMEQFMKEHPDQDPIQLMAAAAVLATGGKPLLNKEKLQQFEFEDRRGRRTDRSREAPFGDRHGRRSGGRYSEYGRGRRGAPYQEDRDHGGYGGSENRGRRNERRRGGSDDRNQAGGGHRDRRPQGEQDAEVESGMQRLTLNVGHYDQVRPGNIVGAIAGETGLESGRIGRIQIFEQHSTVDVPADLPQEFFKSLDQAWFAGRRLTGGDEEPQGRPHQQRPRGGDRSSDFGGPRQGGSGGGGSRRGGPRRGGRHLRSAADNRREEYRGSRRRNEYRDGGSHDENAAPFGERRGGPRNGEGAQREYRSGGPQGRSGGGEFGGGRPRGGRPRTGRPGGGPRPGPRQGGFRP